MLMPLYLNLAYFRSCMYEGFSLRFLHNGNRFVFRHPSGMEFLIVNMLRTCGLIVVLMKCHVAVI